MAVALIVISIGYGFHYEFVCRDAFPVPLCQSLSLAVPRMLCAMALVGLVLLVKSDIRREMLGILRRQPDLPFLCLLAVGFLIVLVPLVYLTVTSSLLNSTTMLMFWIVGLAVSGVGLGGALVDPTQLRSETWRKGGATVLFVVLVGLALPDVVLLFQAAWTIDALSYATFDSVAWVLRILGQAVESIPEEMALVIDDFGVAVGPQCSGIEGFALITVFTLVYLVLFRQQLMMRRAMWVLPCALLLSWCLNVIRIAVLILIGRYISPDLAIDGFHSHAGWIAFLVLALGVAFAAHKVTWFRKPLSEAEQNLTPDATEKPPFFADPAVVFVLPFAVFMASSTVTSALSETPALLYPLRALAVLVILILGRQVLRRMDWTVDPLAVLAGGICGGLWLLTAAPAGDADIALVGALDALPPVLFAGWAFSRVIGTAVLVPILEEAFFRGYLQDRIGGIGGAWAKVWPWVGLAVGAVLFGALHDRYVAGALAGLLFGLIYMRQNRLADAIYAHAAANIVIAAAALYQGAWYLI